MPRSTDQIITTATPIQTPPDKIEVHLNPSATPLADGEG